MTRWAWSRRLCRTTSALWRIRTRFGGPAGALLGLGSTYRILGRYGQAVETLRRGVEEFPDDGSLRTFLAMALYNTDEHHEAMRLLLELTAATSRDPHVQQYRRAIEHYAKDLDEIE